MARFEGLAEEPEILSGGPWERFSSPRRLMIRVLALGFVAVALAGFAGYRLGVSHAHSRPAVLLRNDRSVVPIPSGNPSGEGFGAGSIWVPIWTRPFVSNEPGYVARYDPATRQLLAKLRVGSDPLAVQPGFGSMWVTNAADGTVTRIDPGDDALSKPIRVGPFPYQMAPRTAACGSRRRRPPSRSIPPPTGSS